MSICRVRVANELGAGNGKGAKFATIVSVLTSIVIGLFFWIFIMFYHDKLAFIFSSSQLVVEAVNKLSILLAFTILLNSVQPVLSGRYINFLINFSHLLFLQKYLPMTAFKNKIMFSTIYSNKILVKLQQLLLFFL